MNLEFPHILQHLVNKSVAVCDKCPKTFAEYASSSHHRRKIYNKCQMEVIPFLSNSNEIDLRKVQGFEIKTELKQYEEKQLVKTEPTTNIYGCDLCSDYFKESSMLLKHKLNIRSIEVAKEQLLENDLENDEKYKDIIDYYCNFCPKLLKHNTLNEENIKVLHDIVSLKHKIENHEDIKNICSSNIYDIKNTDSIINSLDIKNNETLDISGLIKIKNGTKIKKYSLNLSKRYLINQKEEIDPLPKYLLQKKNDNIEHIATDINNEDIFTLHNMIETDLGTIYLYDCDICSEVFSDTSILRQHQHEKHNKVVRGRNKSQTNNIDDSSLNTNEVVSDQNQLKFKSLSEIIENKENDPTLLRLQKAESNSMKMREDESKVIEMYKGKSKPIVLQETELNLLRIKENESKILRIQSEGSKQLETQVVESISLDHAEETDSDVREKRSVFSCQYCLKLFNQQLPDVKEHEILETHLKSHPIHHTKQYKCESCNKCFKSISALKTHERIHTGDKPFKCNVCYKTFSQQGKVKLHNLIHTNRRQYKCESCHKSFRDISALKRHKLTHSNVGQYCCVYCPKTFHQKNNMKAHERSHTEEKPFKCSKCDEKFTHSVSLKTHTKKHNKTDVQIV